MKKSSFDRVSTHLRTAKAKQPVTEDLEDDVEMLLRRLDSVRTVNQAASNVELSPYMKSLLRVSKMDAPKVRRQVSRRKVAVSL